MCEFLPSLLPAVAASPDAARPEPGDDCCVAMGHRQLPWTEEIQRLRGGVIMRWLVDARCGDCNQPQTRVRLVYPPDRILEIIPLQQPRPDDATSPASEVRPLDDTTQQPGATDPGVGALLTDASREGGGS